MPCSARASCAVPRFFSFLFAAAISAVNTPLPSSRFSQEKRVVILLTGRHAGKKAVIIKASDDGTSSRPYGHALVVGLDRSPRKVIRKSSEAKQAKAAKLRTFIKVVNYQVRVLVGGVYVWRLEKNGRAGRARDDVR